MLSVNTIIITVGSTIYDKKKQQQQIIEHNHPHHHLRCNSVASGEWMDQKKWEHNIYNRVTQEEEEVVLFVVFEYHEEETQQ